MNKVLSSRRLVRSHIGYIWIHLLLLAVAEVGYAALLLIVNNIFPGFNSFFRSGFGIFAINLLNGLIMLGLIGFFSAAKEIASFFSNDLLLTRPSFSAAAGTSFACACLAFLLLHVQRRTGVTGFSHLERALQVSGETGPVYFALLALIGPFFEEAILRGYFYSRFRETYTIVGSVTILTGVAALLHLSAVSTAPTSFVGITALTILMCLALEYSRTTWTSVIGHTVYNAVCVFG